jgi:hypothetical protein
MPTNQQRSQHSLEEQLIFVKGGIQILENQKKAEIIIDKDNIEMLKAIKESLDELKLSE